MSGALAEPARLSLGSRLQRFDPWLVALLALALFLPGIGSRDLWNPDEPRYAEVAREMAEGPSPMLLAARAAGHAGPALGAGMGPYLLVPHLDGRLYSEKPPLQFWAILLFSLATGGVDEVATRLPAVASVTGTLLLIFAMAQRLFSRRAAWLAVAAFGTCAGILWQGRIGQIDMLLIFLVTASMAFWVRGWQEGRRGFYWLYFLVAGVATVAKGPVGLLPTLLAIAAFSLWTRQPRLLAKMRIGRGLLLWTLPILAWLGPATLVAGLGYPQTMIFRQSVQRFAEPWHHFQPWYYYLTTAPADFFPWILLLPAALVAGWRGLEGREREAFRWALCWVVVTVFFFSLSPGKRSVYVLTMFPALALLLGAGLDRLAAQWPRGRHGLLWPLVALALAGGAAAALLPRAAERRAADLAPLGPGLVGELIGLAIVLALAAAVSAWLVWRDRPLAAAGILTAGMGLATVVAMVTVLPRFDVVKSARPLARELLARSRPDEPYALYPRLDATFLFYTRRFAVFPTSEAELHEFARRPGRVWLLIERPALARLAAPLPLTEVAGEPDRAGYVLMTTPPPAAPLSNPGGSP